LQPVRCELEPPGQQIDIEYFFPILGLFFGQQINQQRPQAGLNQALGHKLVARTEPAAAAAVGKQHHFRRAGRHNQIAFQPVPTHRDLHHAFVLCFPRCRTHIRLPPLRIRKQKRILPGLPFR
jgi:hypothetical protein